MLAPPSMIPRPPRPLVPICSLHSYNTIVKTQLITIARTITYHQNKIIAFCTAFPLAVHNAHFIIATEE